MKRLIVIIGVIFFFAINIFAQGETDGVKGTGWRSRRYKENIKDSTFFQIAPTYASGQYIDNATVFGKLQPDTVQHTTNYTVQASDWGKDQHLRKATSMVITLPPNLTEWPVGGIINFYGGVGITVFKKGVGVIFESPLDSIATSAKYEGVSVLKIAASKYRLTGALKD